MQGDPPTSASQIAGTTGPHHHTWLILFLVEMGLCHVGQDGLKLPISGDPYASASQSAGITGVSHCTWPRALSLSFLVHSLITSESQSFCSSNPLLFVFLLGLPLQRPTVDHKQAARNDEWSISLQPLEAGIYFRQGLVTKDNVQQLRPEPSTPHHPGIATAVL